MRARRMSMETSMLIAIAAAAAIGSWVTALVITTFVLAAEILELLASGMTCEEILSDYDELERDDILAVLEFAALDFSARLQRIGA